MRGEKQKRSTTPSPIRPFVIGEDEESELLRGAQSGGKELHPDGTGSDRNNNTKGPNISNVTVADEDDVFLSDDDEEMGSALSSSPSGGQTASTPRNKTKENWEDITIPGEDEAEDANKKKRSRGNKAARGSVRHRRRASVAQRQRRAREKNQQAIREGNVGSQPDAHHLPQQQTEPTREQQTAHAPVEPNVAGTSTGIIAGVQMRTMGPPMFLPPWAGPGQQQQQQQQQHQEDQQQPQRQPPQEQAQRQWQPEHHGQQRSLDVRAVSAMDVLTPEAVRGMSEAVNRRCAGGNGEFFDPDDTAIDHIQMDTEYSGGAHDTTTELDSTQVFSVRDLVGDQMEVAEGVQIRSRDIVSYVLLKWDSTTDTNWSVPDPQLFHDLVNRVESRPMELKLRCGDVLKWSNLWGKVGLLGLSIKDRDLLTEFRELVERQVTGTMKFSIYPRDALEKKGNVSVLLRETYRGLDVTQLPRSIFRRTRALRGGLKVTHVKYYGDEERSRTGASKKGWRLVLLQGDSTFMDSLEQFEPEHRFWVGSDRIIIRGGVRKNPSKTPTRGGSGSSGQGDAGPPGPRPQWQGQRLSLIHI